MKKILIAIEDSKGSFKAVDFVSHHFSGISNVQITLFHVLQNMPAEFWDDGHVLSEDERKKREEVIDKWLANRKIKIEPFFKKAVKMLTEKGINPQQISTKTVSETYDIADSILNEIKDGGYQILVLGRHSYSTTERILMGSVTSKIITHGAGIAVCVIE